MPWPSSVSVQQGSVPLDKNFSIAFSGAGASDPRVRLLGTRTPLRLARQTGVFVKPSIVKDASEATLAIVVEQPGHGGAQKLGDDEGYSLSVADGHIRLSATAPLGAVRGAETLLQLVRQGDNGFAFPAVSIQDQPRFPWRGLSLDVSRHFIPVDEIKRTLDGMCAVKLNVLHWHLSDDQGFRVESKKYPRLQKYGSEGQYYTQVQVRDVIAYAADRGIRIVPEFDMPGHATSWLAAYPNLGSGSGKYDVGHGFDVYYDLMDPTKESTYRFLDGFIGEMSKLFPDEYFHIGGDEVEAKQWNENPAVSAFMRQHNLADAKALQTYFNQRLLKIVTKHGKHMEGWDEIFQPNLPKTIVIQSWRGQRSLWQAAAQGYQGILSAGYYLDLMYPASDHYAADPMKLPPSKKEDEQSGPAPELTPEQKKLILGGEAASWEELVSLENFDSRLWPRLAAIAERFWSPESVTDVQSMYRRLAYINGWLEWLGLGQRSKLLLMRVRLTGGVPSPALEAFASILEPVKGYERHAEKYTTTTPLVSLALSIPPESDAAREFRDAIESFLNAPKSNRDSAKLRERLTFWETETTAVKPVLQANPLLRENLSVADATMAVCKAGLEALDYLDSAAPSGWKQTASAAVDQYVNKRVGETDFLIQIAPGVQKLIAAVP